MGRKLIAIRKSNFLSFKSNFVFTFLTNSKIKNINGIKIPICLARKIIGYFM